MTDKAIAPKKQLPQDVLAALASADADFDYQIGDQFISRWLDVSTVTNITIDNEEKSRERGEILYHLTDEDGRARTYTAIRLGRDSYIKLRKPLAEYTADALKALTDPDFLEKQDNLRTKTAVSETALAIADDSSDLARKAKQDALILKEKAELMQRLIEKMMQPMKEMAHKMKNRLGYLNNMLAVMETFLGLYESVETLRDGQPSPVDTPLSIFQLVRYMDEEAGITARLREDDTRGIDWASVDVFDEWLMADPAHLERVAPAEKCIVALRPSRQNRTSATKDWWEASQDNSKNRMMYLLIRNGEQVHRIWAGYGIGEMLFPTIDDWGKLMESVQKEAEADGEQYNAKGIELGWKRHIALLTGLMERTLCLRPLPHHIDLFKPDTYGNVIHLIRDGEGGALTNGRQRFDDWQLELNEQLTRGDRVFIAPIPWNVGDKNSLWRYGGDLWGDAIIPEKPNSGVYSIEGTEDRVSYMASDQLKILYMQDSDVWVKDDYWEGMTTKKRTRRDAFYLNRTDGWVLPYDSLDVDTLRYYIDSRIERPDYLAILPVLCGLLVEIEKEAIEELGFMTLVADEMGIDVGDVQTAVIWWKTKVIAKRPIRSDNAKAWRMIRGRIRSERKKTKSATAK